MKTRPLLLLFIALCVVQLATPSWLAMRYEDVLRNGETYRVRIEPVDPADAFRGRFVAMALLLPLETPPTEPAKETGREGWVVLASGPDGFAQAASFSWERPATASGPVVRARLVHDWRRDGENRQAPEFYAPADPAASKPRYAARLLVERYYLDEGIAPRADQVVGRAPQVPERPRESVAVLRVKDATVAIAAVEVNGEPLERFLGNP